MSDPKEKFLPIGKSESEQLPIITTNDKIILASKETRVALMGQNKEPLKEALVYIFDLIGLKELKYPDKREQSILVQFIDNKLSMYSPSDFKIAFEMAVSGEIKVENMNHYQNFNSLYLSDVMKVYKEYRNKIVTEQRLKEQADQFKERTFTDEEIQKSRESFYKTMIVEEYNSFFETGNFTIPIYSAKMVYKEMESRGMINITREEKKELFKLYVEKVREERKIGNAFERALMPNDFESLVKTNCYYHSIREAFVKMKNENVKL